MIFTRNCFHSFSIPCPKPTSPPILITPTLLSTLTAQAQASPRLRQHYDLRDSAEDSSQRMLNAIEPGTVIEVHRHTGTSETVAVLRGVAEEVFFDEEGNEIGRYRLTPGGAEPGSFVAIQGPMSPSRPATNQPRPCWIKAHASLPL